MKSKITKKEFTGKKLDVGVFAEKFEAANKAGKNIKPINKELASIPSPKKRIK